MTDLPHGDVIGSLLRPPELLAARKAIATGSITDPEFKRIEDQAVDKMFLLRQLKDKELVADVGATVDFLQAYAAADGDALGITGFCMGGRVVYLMAAAVPAFKAAVAYYGGNIMVPWGEDVPAPFERSGEIGCPLMFHFGEEDSNPSPEDREKLDAELMRLGKAHEFYAYDGAGHAFMDFTREERHREEADALSWKRTLAFFAQYLKG